MTTARHAGTDPFSPAGSASDRDLSISLDRPHLVARTFLLGNDDGFVLH